jgi:hypothetical protein
MTITPLFIDAIDGLARMTTECGQPTARSHHNAR